jgi:hypothetical protein
MNKLKDLLGFVPVCLGWIKERALGNCGRKILLLSMWLLLGTNPEHAAFAGVGVWTSNGPEGGDIRALAIDPVTPTTLYAGTFGGVFKSTDGGGSWQAMNIGLVDSFGFVPFVYALVIDPVTPTTLYAGTSGGVFKSTDGGGSWNPMNTDLIDPFFGFIPSVSALAIDPVIPTTLYAGTGVGVFKSTDGGGELELPKHRLDWFLWPCRHYPSPGDRSGNPHHPLCGDWW